MWLTGQGLVGAPLTGSPPPRRSPRPQKVRIRLSKITNRALRLVMSTDVADRIPKFQLTSIPTASWNTFRDFVLQKGPDVREFH